MSENTETEGNTARGGRVKLEGSKCYAQLRKTRRIMQANQSVRFIAMARSVANANKFDNDQHKRYL